MAVIMSDKFPGGSSVAMEHDTKSKQVVVYHSSPRIFGTFSARFEMTPQQLNAAVEHYDRCVAFELQSPSNVGTSNEIL